MNDESPSFYYEELIGSQTIAGIDEVGYGAWAGPIVAASVILFKENIPSSLLKIIRDSKQLSQKKREEIFKQLTTNASFCAFNIGIAHVEEINELNILNATFLAMQRAYQKLKPRPSFLLIDGNRFCICEISYQTLVKGDQKSYSIAAASIIAKVTRDQMMSELGKNHPDFQWNKNKGYGTKHHETLLFSKGPTPFHRLSYRPVSRANALFNAPSIKTV